MSSIPNPETKLTSYTKTVHSIWFPGVEKLVEEVKEAIEACGDVSQYPKPINLRGAQALAALHIIYPFAIQAANAKAKHFEDHFQKLARVHGPASAALDTARREWAKKGEG